MMPPDNEIWYTSNDGNVVTPTSNLFGANIVSNTYENDKGVITFDGDVIVVGQEAFYNCSSLTSIAIPNSVTGTREYAFYECSSLTSVILGNSITNIGYSVFYNCSSLTSITIPESVTLIEEEAFRDCSSLNHITYEGTQAQWNTVRKDYNWNYNVPATYVQCTDGQVEL